MTQITLHREVLEQAIEALEWAGVHPAATITPTEAITALRTALEAPAAPKEEPVSMQWLAEMIMSDCGCSTNNQRLLDRIINRIDKYERANAAPAAREPLTAAQIRNLPLRYPVGFGVALLVARAIEAAHGIGMEQK